MAKVYEFLANGFEEISRHFAMTVSDNRAVKELWVINSTIIRRFRLFLTKMLIINHLLCFWAKMAVLEPLKSLVKLQRRLR